MSAQISPVLQFLRQGSNSSSPTTNNIKKLMQFVQSAPDQAAAMQQLAAKNPQLREALDMAGNGMTRKQAFYNRARELGQNPEALLRSLMS